MIPTVFPSGRVLVIEEVIVPSSTRDISGEFSPGTMLAATTGVFGHSVCEFSSRRKFARTLSP